MAQGHRTRRVLQSSVTGKLIRGYNHAEFENPFLNSFQTNDNVDVFVEIKKKIKKNLLCVKRCCLVPIKIIHSDTDMTHLNRTSNRIQVNLAINSGAF